MIYHVEYMHLCVASKKSFCYLHLVGVESKAEVIQIKIRHVAGYPVSILL